MKPEQDDRLEAGGDLGSPREFSVERLQQPEIVGHVDNPTLEAIRRLWWRSFDRVCGFFVPIRLSIHDRIYGPEPPTPADLQREADHERLLRVFPEMDETIKPTDYGVQNRDGEIGSHYRYSSIRKPSFAVPARPRQKPPAFPETWLHGGGENRMIRFSLKHPAFQNCVRPTTDNSTIKSIYDE
jgi:hypothetical protein